MRTPKIIALLAFRDEEKYLPGYFRHLERYVDGFICIDDGSVDNSFNIMWDNRSKLICANANPTPTHPHANEVANRKSLLEEAKKQGADWVLCTDADERYEKGFLEGLRDFTTLPQPMICHVRVRDLWNSPHSYRVDGIWKHKSKPVLFPMANFDGNYRYKGDLHSTWVPDSIGSTTIHYNSDFNLYHLRSIHAEDRAKRVAKFNQIDPEKKFQAIGYDYLNDETGLKLEQIPAGREYEGL